MATWIAHLRVAESLLSMLGGLDASPFAVGNIAPDSGMPDEKWEKFDPPVVVTHFAAPAGSAHELADLEFYRRHRRGLEAGNDPARYAFLLGYFCHLVTDNLWSLRIGRPTVERFQAEFAADPDFIWEVKKDWYGLDFEYVRDQPDSLYWCTFLQCDYPVNYLDILLAEGVRHRISFIQTYYREINEHALERLNHPRIYLTMPEVDAFVDEAAFRLNAYCRRLGLGDPDTSGTWSALEWDGL